MNRKELEIKLNEIGVPPHFYNLYGGVRDQKQCLEETYQGWEVYYSERGHKNALKTFKTEEDACECVYKRIMEDFDLMNK